jgi:hypothetical protein
MGAWEGCIIVTIALLDQEPSSETAGPELYAYILYIDT